MSYYIQSENLKDDRWMTTQSSSDHGDFRIQRAWSAGIIPETSSSTHWKRAWMRRQISYAAAAPQRNRQSNTMITFTDHRDSSCR